MSWENGQDATSTPRITVKWVLTLTVNVEAKRGAQRAAAAEEYQRAPKRRLAVYTSMNRPSLHHGSLNTWCYKGL